MRVPIGVWQRRTLSCVGRWRTRGRVVSALMVCTALGAAASAPCAAQSVLTGQVIDAQTKRPLANARIVSLNAKLTSITDSAGRFRLVNISAGAHKIVVQAIGFDSASVTMRFRNADTVAIDVELSPMAAKLATIITTALPDVYKLQLKEFAERRVFGIGKFLDARYFEKYANRDLGTVLLSQVAGIRVIGRGASGRLASTTTGRICYVQTIVNGIVREGFDVSEVGTGDVVGFEYYTPGSTPVKYSASGSREGGAQCGTAVFWIK
jgi:hypothetical protein